MATYKTDFSEYTVGTQPSDWTPIWVTTNSTWQIASDAGATDGQVLRHTSTTDARRLMTWDTVGSVNGDFDILLKFKTTDSLSGNIPTRIFAYASGSSTQSTQQGYQLDALFPATLRIGRTVNGSYSTLASNTAMPIAFTANTWYWFRFRKVGTSLMGRAWEDGTAEQSTWDVSTSSTSLSSGSIGIGSYDYNGTRSYDYFSVGTNGDTAPSPVEAPPPDTTAPAEITNLTETHTDIVIEFNWTNPTDADFYSVNAYKNGTKIAGDLGSTFTDTNVSPNTTYLYRFTTVDTVGNESNGTEISVTTDPQKQYRHLKPIEIVSINNFTPNDVTYIQDDPMNEDANVLTTIDNLSNPSIRLKFETPDSPISGLQTMRWVVDDPYYVGSRITIYDSGVQVYQSGMKYPQGGTQPIVETFNADVLTDTTMQNVEVELLATVYQGDTIANLGAIEWTFPVDETIVPIDGAITATSSGSASLTRAYDVSGSLSVTSTVEGSLQTNKGLQGNSDSVSVVGGNVTIDRGLSGQSDSVSTVSADSISRAFEIMGEIDSTSTLEGTIGKEIGLTGSVGASSSLVGGLEETEGIFGSITANVTIQSTLSIDRGIEGNVTSQSSIDAIAGIQREIAGSIQAESFVSAVPLLRIRSLQGDVLTVTSELSADMLEKIVVVDGVIGADSSLSGIIEKGLTLQGQISSDSSVTGEIDRSILMDGSIGAASSVEEAILPIYRGLNGTISAQSTSTASFSIKGEIQLRGDIGVTSTTNAFMGIGRPLEGTIENQSALQADRLLSERAISGSVEANSDINGSLNRTFSLDGSVSANTDVYGNVNRFISLDSLIEVNSDMSGAFTLEGQVTLRGRIDAQSTLSTELAIQFGISGNILSNSDVESSIWVEAQLIGEIEALSSVLGDVTRGIPLDAQISSFSSVLGELILEGFLPLNGQIESLSNVSSSMNVLHSLIGWVDSVSDLSNPVLNRQRLIDGSISSLSSIQGRAGLTKLVEGDISANSNLYVQEPIDTLVEVDSVLYSGVATEDDQKVLSYTIDSGVGRRIEFVFSFIVSPTNLRSLVFRIEGTLGQPFTLQAYNVVSKTWDSTTTVTYDGKTAEQFVTLTLTDYTRYLSASNELRIRMLSVNRFTSGTLTLSTDYAELVKTYTHEAR
ncbi:hypothetical protein SAMN04487777_11770 [Priestia aryabhattai B8W22]|uniref:hypothetical protein n=1 Tax=Priestia aryabhattai TaxID=412384 RepID=UPI000890C756|nr:hypothetical protein SAMN04487777_11770 [Priestia aryabhattai B8W22]